jgi:hypothetical protein
MEDGGLKDSPSVRVLPHDAEPRRYVDPSETIIRAVLTKGILPPSQQQREAVGSISSATSESDHPLSCGNILVPKIEIEFDEARDEFRFIAVGYDDGTRRLIEPITHDPDLRYFDQPYDLPRSLWTRYQAYRNGSNNPDLVDQMERMLDPVRRILYPARYGVLPVIAERPWIIRDQGVGNPGSPEYQALELYQVEDMMSNSFVVVADLDKVYSDAITHTLVNVLSSGSFEYKTPDPVLPADFEAIFVPENLRKIFERVGIDNMRDRIKFVGQRERFISIYKWAEYRMRVPDYEGGLKELIARNPTRPFWVHGVRLYSIVDGRHDMIVSAQKQYASDMETLKAVRNKS